MATWNDNTNGTRPSMSQNTMLEVECPNLAGKKSQNRFVIPLNKNFSVSKIFTTSWSFAKCKYAHVQFFQRHCSSSIVYVHHHVHIRLTNVLVSWTFTSISTFPSLLVASYSPPCWPQSSQSIDGDLICDALKCISFISLCFCHRLTTLGRLAHKGWHCSTCPYTSIFRKDFGRQNFPHLSSIGNKSNQHFAEVSNLAWINSHNLWGAASAWNQSPFTLRQFSLAVDFTFAGEMQLPGINIFTVV